MTKIKTPTILIVEDHDEHSASLAVRFKQYGAKYVYIEKTVSAAMRRLQLLKTNGIIVTYAIVDNNLPGPMGMKVATYIKRHYPKIKIGIIGETVTAPAAAAEAVKPVETTLDYSDTAMRKYRQAVVLLERKEDLARAIKSAREIRRGEHIIGRPIESQIQSAARDKMRTRFEALFLKFFTANDMEKRSLLKELQHIHMVLFSVPLPLSEISNRWRVFLKTADKEAG